MAWKTENCISFQVNNDPSQREYDVIFNRIEKQNIHILDPSQKNETTTVCKVDIELHEGRKIITLRLSINQGYQ